MKCPQCDKPRCKYLEKVVLIKRKSFEGDFQETERQNFNAKCPSCKWEGEIR